DDVVGLDYSILMHPMVWKSSGHADKFADLIAECKKCNTRTRVDHLREKVTEQTQEHTEHIAIDAAMAKAQDLSNKVCPNCGAVGRFTEPMPFNLMFETRMGANVDDSMTMHLRPETAQGIFANFRNVLAETKIVFLQAQADIPIESGLLPVLEPLVIGARLTEKLQFRLLEFARPEDKGLG
ncbi:unnamed protein product, partial [marine sediment metagenome]